MKQYNQRQGQALVWRCRERSRHACIINRYDGISKGRETSEKEKKTNRAVQKCGATLHFFIFCWENEEQLVIN